MRKKVTFTPIFLGIACSGSFGADDAAGAVVRSASEIITNSQANAGISMNSGDLMVLRIKGPTEEQRLRVPPSAHIGNVRVPKQEDAL